MSYFSNIPNIKYPYFGVTQSSSTDEILTKNIFRRAKLRDDFIRYYTFFQKYQILGDERPDTVAYKIYERPDYDWIVLLVNNIVNIKREWPMTQLDLNNYLNAKYTPEELVKVKYYETTEVRDSYGRLILPAGLRVKEDYQIEYFDDLVRKSSPLPNAVTYYEYESLLNDQKRNIYILKPSIVSSFIEEFKDVVRYSNSSDLIDGETKGTFNPFINQ
jgi:hypothetical protein